MTEFENRTQQNNSSTKGVVDYHKAMLIQKERDLNKLRKQLDSLKLLNTTLLGSLSYRIGRAITLPFRFVIGLNGSKKKVQNPIKATVDSAFLSNGLIEVVGWALSDSKISTVEICLNSNNYELAELGLFREDVMQSFPNVENSQFSGFTTLVKGSLSDNLVVKVTDENNNTVELEKVVFPATGEMSLNAQYKIFLEQHATSQLDKIIQLTNTKFLYRPLLSIVVPVYNVDAKWLNACIESVVNQIYPHWELYLYDDCSSHKETLSCLNKWRLKDKRIRIGFGKKNKGIALASNEAISLAQGEFVALLDHDDELTQEALACIVYELNQNRSLNFIYSDEDKINLQGELCDPHFKSGFNLDALLSWNYICHFSVIRKSVGDKVGWFREGYEGSQDHDLFLRIVAETQKIQHIPHALYHWRKVEGSTAIATSNKSYAEIAGKKAVASYLKSQKIDAAVEGGLFPNSYRVKYSVDESDLVSIVIPFRNELSLLKACVESVLSKTTYTNYEILLVDNQSDDNNVIDYCNNLVGANSNIKLFHFDEDFNFSKINNYAVSKAKGDLLLFLNNDIEVIDDDWLRETVSQIQQQNVAAVGAKLLFEDNTIQHSGVVVSKVGAVHPNKGLDDLAIGYFQRANYVQNVSACTGACLLVKKSIFLEVGGFDEELFAIAYNDVDLCLKIRQAGYLITYTPYAKLYHYESKSRGYDDSPEKLERFSREIKNYQKKWGEIYKYGDPYYNPNLKQTSEKIYLNID